MKEDIEKLTAELVRQMPELKDQENELGQLLLELLAAKPDVQMDPAFKAELKKRLLTRQVPISHLRWSWARFALPLAGLAVVVLLIIAKNHPEPLPGPVAVAPPQQDTALSESLPSGGGGEPRLMAANKGIRVMNVTSPYFQTDSSLPEKYTCDGQGLSPALDISDVPAGTQSLALIVEDPDAPNGDFIHWVIWDIPSSVNSLKEGQLPDGSKEGINTSGQKNYVPPCPPAGTVHHYIFTVYSLDTVLDFSEQPDAVMLRQAMNGHLLAEASITGLYQRK